MLQQLKNIASEEGFRYQEFIERATTLKRVGKQSFLWYNKFDEKNTNKNIIHHIN